MENPARDTTSAPPVAQPVGLQTRAGGASDRIVIIQHSDLFYWWPVWAFGFLFAFITYLTDDHMAIVPRGTRALPQRKIELEPGLEVTRDVLVLDQDAKLLERRDETGAKVIAQPTIYVSRYKSLGVMYMFILLIVTFITNVPLRGLWSFVVMLSVLMLSIIFALAGWWDIIFEYLGNLSIHINMGGYLLVSTVLFVLWLIAFLFLDRQMYVIFTPGQVRLCTEIGGAETIYDTFGMTVQKQRSDLFRHWVLGFGSGDMLLRFAKVEHPIEMHNVLNITSSLKKVERLVQEKVVITEPAPAPAGGPKS